MSLVVQDWRQDTVDFIEPGREKRSRFAVCLHRQHPDTVPVVGSRFFVNQERGSKFVQPILSLSVGYRRLVVA